MTMPPANRRRPLSERQVRFVAEYLLDYNGTQAAIRAGYSEQSARGIASTLLRHPEIDQRVREHRDRVHKAMNERAELNTQRTLQTIAAVQDFDPADMLHPDGSPKKIQEMPHSARMAIAGFEVVTKYVGKGENRRKIVQHKVRLLNRLTATDMAAKVAGAYKADNEQRRSTRDMTDEDLMNRLMVLMGRGTPPEPPQPAEPDAAPPGTRLQ